MRNTLPIAQNRCTLLVFADHNTRRDQDASQANRCSRSLIFFECGNTRGISSVGRAIPCQGIGREFESLIPLHISKGSPVDQASLFSSRRKPVATDWRGSKAVMPRIANPVSPVRLRTAPPRKSPSRHREGLFSLGWPQCHAGCSLMRARPAQGRALATASSPSQA
jgi:hypothetical protein